MHNFGLKDLPIENFDDETLGLRTYADSLSEFIQQCETPLTIALQGDWGSGKTSLMNLIRKNIGSQNSIIKTIWFNTWQFSQFDMSGDLAISLISHFIDSLTADDQANRDELKKKLWSFTKNLTKVGIVAAASVVGQEKAGKEIVSHFDTADNSDPAQKIMSLKTSIENLVAAKINKKNELGNRIVVFVDDLDRLLPEKAVELLEVFKLFLDIPGCVYILACDYQVVTQGLKKKFGLTSDELKGKSFFDKIIQLPFQMPIGQYAVNEYIAKLLEKIKVDYESADIKLYESIVNYSVGFNPRTMKRLFNSLLLLNMVAKRQGILDDDKNALTSEKQRVIFGTLCLQIAYEPLYRYLQKNKETITQELFDVLLDPVKLRAYEGLQDLKKELGDTVNCDKLSLFMKALHESLQLKSDNDDKRLSRDEIDNFKHMLSFSALTSTGTATESAVQVDWEERSANKEIAYALANKVNDKYKSYLEKLNGATFNSRRTSTDSTDACTRCGLGLNNGVGFYIDIWFGKLTEGEFYLGVWLPADNSQSKNFIKSLIDNNLAHDFPSIDYEDSDGICLFRKVYPEKAALDTEIEAQSFNALDKILPLLIKEGAIS